MTITATQNLHSLTSSGLGLCTYISGRVLGAAKRVGAIVQDFVPDPRLGLIALGWDAATGIDPLQAGSTSMVLFGLHVGLRIAQKIRISYLGSTPLHVAVFWNEIETAKRLLVKEVNPNVVDCNGMTPLHWATSAKMVELLVEAGAKVNIPDKNGMTPLHFASGKGFTEVVRALLRNRADPTVATHRGNFPAQFTKSVEIFRILTGMENWKQLDGCKSIEEVFEFLFPRSLVGLPENWENLERSLRFVPELDQLCAEGERLIGTYVPSIEELSQGSELPQDLEGIRRILYENNPLFRKAWDLANKDRSIILKEGDESDFLSDGKRTLPAGEGAHFFFADHSITITIDRGGSFQTKCDRLIFETINAIQLPTFEWIENEAKLGSISREDYAFLKERTEMNSYQMRSMVYWAGQPFERRIDVAEIWIHANRIWNGGNQTHADKYRYVWDRLYRAIYIQKNGAALSQASKSETEI